MQFNIISYTLFLILMVMFFPSLIYGPWTEDDPPKKPYSDAVKLTCAGWIHFNGFVLGEYSINREKAMDRDPEYDRKASTWAAGYAFKISGTEEIYQITPQEFCDSFGDVNLVPKSFKALKKEKLSCAGWIKLYGFSDDVEDNKLYARNTTPTKAQFMSIYAYDYWKFIQKRRGITDLNPSEHCSLMRVYEYEHRFVCPYSASLTCLEWMILYEFNGTPSQVLRKSRALTTDIVHYPIQIHFFPESYGVDIIASNELEIDISRYTALAFCLTFRGTGDASERYSYFFRKYWT